MINKIVLKDRKKLLYPQNVNELCNLLEYRKETGKQV